MTVRCRLVSEHEAKPVDFGDQFSKIVKVKIEEYDEHISQVSRNFLNNVAIFNEM